MPQPVFGTAQQYITSFNAIEAELRVLYQRQDSYISFSQLVHRLRHEHPVIRRYADDLIEFAELRNAIVHNLRDDQILATPLESTVKEIKAIETALTNPLTVYPEFARTVFTVPVQAKLAEALALMREKNISQVPVTNGTDVVVEVLNGNSIARWLSRQSQVVPAEVSVEQILPDIEIRNNYKFIPRIMTVYEAAETYERSYRDGWYADALLITNSGRNGQSLLGIIVLEDIAPYIV